MKLLSDRIYSIKDRTYKIKESANNSKRIGSNSIRFSHKYTERHGGFFTAKIIIARIDLSPTVSSVVVRMLLPVAN